ncbi:prolipoprotein diacylglyceryl transferase [Tundrisphaera lichenicola]|uniref:prolipoprotein diacylglyceryl transferase n=1 Tax=Tundrisphaera lichenicola TaxID=2029860 RepID=UPI003EB9A483
MWQILFEVPGLGLKIHGFSLMLVAAAGSAVYLTAWRAARERINPEVVFELAVWLLSGGFIGARALFLMEYPETIHSFWDIFKVWQGGIVFYGCIIGGLIGSVAYWFRNPFPFRAMCDAVAPSLAIGIALGRVGCFLNGCCFGGVCDLPWAITFPSGSLPWTHHVEAGWILPEATRSLAIHPAQIYAVLDGLILLVLLTAYYPRRRRDGEVMALLMVCYPATRFLIEWLRDDEGAFLMGLTISQTISALLFPCGLLTWWYLSRQPLGRYADHTQGLDAGAVPAPMVARPSKLAKPAAR